MDINKELKATVNREVLIKKAVASIREKKSNNYLKVSSMKDKLDMNKLLSADNTSEFEEYFNTLEC